MGREIVPGTDGLDESGTSSMTVLVSNLSTRTMVRIEAKFSPDGVNLVRGARSEHLHKRIVDDSRHSHFRHLMAGSVLLTTAFLRQAVAYGSGATK